MSDATLYRVCWWRLQCADLLTTRTLLTMFDTPPLRSTQYLAVPAHLFQCPASYPSLCSTRSLLLTMCTTLLTMRTHMLTMRTPLQECMEMIMHRFGRERLDEVKPEPQTLNPKPQTPHSKPQSPNPKLQTPNPKPHTLNA